MIQKGKIISEKEKGLYKQYLSKHLKSINYEQGRYIAWKAKKLNPFKDLAN
jgi:hypothetical protein